MFNRLSRYSCLAAVALLGFATITSAAEPPETSSKLTLLRGEDIGRFTSTPTGNPKVVTTHDQAVGESANLGSYTLTAKEDVNLETLEVTEGRFTITAANGDTLRGRYSGTAHTVGIPNVIQYDVVGSITGGTGQFDDARGVVLFHGTADLAAGALTDDLLAAVSSEK